MRRTSCVIAAATLVAGLGLMQSAAFAHTQTFGDENDVPGSLDIRSTSVGHRFDGQVVHHIQTFGDWSLGTLGTESFFVILIDNAGTHRSFERCAFAFRSRDRLRGVLTNCRSNFIDTLGATKVGGDGVDIKIPRARLGGSYRWVAEAFYTSSGGPCRATCVDAVPNDFPLPLHDVTDPDVKVSAPLLPSDVGTSEDVEVEYSVSERGGAGLESWTLRRTVQDGVSSGEELQAGTSAVNSSVQMDDLVEGTTYAVQMHAVDGQENIGIDTTYVSAPWDDASPGLSDGYSGSWSASTPAGSFAGTMHVATAEDAVLQLTMTVPADHRVRVVWVAPGTGSWSGTLTVSGYGRNASRTVSAHTIADLPRQRIIDLPLDALSFPSPLTIEISVPSKGGAVPVDAVAVVLTPGKAI